MTSPDYRQQQEQEEHYLEVARAIRDLWNGTADEEDVAIVCNACAIDARDIAPPTTQLNEH